MGAGHEFWDERYEDLKDEGDGTFDWYLSYDKIRSVIEPYVDEDNKGDTILVLGCGNSTLNASLYDAGYTNLLGIDISSVVIEQMQTRYIEREGMRFAIQDVCCMDDIPSDSFHLVVDKGTLDSLFCGTTGVNDARLMLNEVCRVMQFGGRFVLITYATPPMRMPHLTREELEWNVETTQITDGLTTTYVYIMEKRAVEAAAAIVGAKAT